MFGDVHRGRMERGETQSLPMVWTRHLQSLSAVAHDQNCSVVLPVRHVQPPPGLRPDLMNGPQDTFSLFHALLRQGELSGTMEEGLRGSRSFTAICEMHDGRS